MKKLHHKVTLTLACLCLALVASGIVQAFYVPQTVTNNPRDCYDCLKIGTVRREYTVPTWWCNVLSLGEKPNDGWIYDCDVYHCINGRKYFRQNPRLADGCHEEVIDRGCPLTQCLKGAGVGVNNGGTQ